MPKKNNVKPGWNEAPKKGQTSGTRTTKKGGTTTKESYKHEYDTSKMTGKQQYRLEKKRIAADVAKRATEGAGRTSRTIARVGGVSNVANSYADAAQAESAKRDLSLMQSLITAGNEGKVTDSAASNDSSASLGNNRDNSTSKGALDSNPGESLITAD